ncbi:MAG: extracellular solute-binding protein [bacterium]
MFDKYPWIFPFLSDLIAGLVGAAILSIMALISRKMGRKQGWQWLNIISHLGWPLMATVFFATALIYAIIRRLQLLYIIVLGILFLLALASVILIRYGPPKARRLQSSILPHVWQILTGIFFLCTLILMIIPRPPLPPGKQIVFVVDLADEEMMVFRDVLDTLEPELGAKVLLMNVESCRHVARLDKMVASGTMKWDLIAVDNNILGILVKKGLVEELSKAGEYENLKELIPHALLPRLRPMLKVEDKFYFAPFRLNVKIAFYNQHKFTEYGLTPPKNWEQLLHVAKVFKEKEGVGRVAIHGYDGKTAAVTIFEFVKSAGGNPLTLDDEGTRKAFAYLQQIEPYLAPEYVETRFDTANELLIDDGIYLVCQWTYGIKVVIKDARKEEIKVYSGWNGPGGQAHVLGGDLLAVPKGASHQKYAIKLIKLLLRKKTQQILASRLCWPPVRQDVYEELPPELDPYFQVINDALSAVVTRPIVPQWSVVEKVLASAFRGLIRDVNDIASLENYSHTLKKLPRRLIIYEVKSRETLKDIAQRYNITADILAEVNGIVSGKSVGPRHMKILLIPRH